MINVRELFIIVSVVLRSDRVGIGLNVDFEIDLNYSEIALIKTAGNTIENLHKRFIYLKSFYILTTGWRVLDLIDNLYPHNHTFDSRTGLTCCCVCVLSNTLDQEKSGAVKTIHF